MLIATITALMMLFGGGVDSPYIIPKADKLVLAEISDKERKAAAKDQIKVYKTTWKAFKKWEKAFQKDYKTTSSDATVESSILYTKLEEYRVKQLALDSELVPIRVKVMGLLTTEEWNRVIDNAVIIPEKKLAKKEKKQIKAELKKSEQLLNFRNDILNSLDESADKEKINLALDNFENELGELSYQEQELFVRIIESVENKLVSEEELINLSSSFLDYRIELSKTFIQLREVLLAETDVENWKKTHKQLVKLM